MNKSLFFKTFRLFIAAAVLCLVCPLQKAVAQSDSGITIKMDNARLESVLDAIEQQSKYLFLNDQVDLSKTVSINVSDADIKVVLDRLFAGSDVDWRIEGTNIYISIKSESDDAADGVRDNRVSGTIVDASGLPVIGAGVLVQGTTVGVSTDLDGKFSFELPDGVDSPVLEIACLGYASQFIPVGDRRVFDVTLETDAIMMEGTVVTALGIKRSEKALSYNVQEVKSDELLSNKDANFVNSLNGKVAGLVINASSSGVGGASKVVMRGQKSISKSSNALYVIDGVPMYTTARDAGTEFDSRGATDPIADLNPEDIESMTVLTGAAAAALYGSAAANGAIVITTRKGQEGKTSVTVSSNTEIFSPFVLPRFQNRYGTGDYNSSEGSITRSWGSKLNTSNFMGYNPAKDYFRMGVTGTESVSLSTGNAKNQTYLSAAAVNSIGNVPNNEYNRYNFTFRNTTKFLNDKMTLDVSASFIMQDDQNMTNQGTYNNPLVGAYLFPRGNDWADIEMYERYDTGRKIYTQYWPVGDAGLTMQNPYWINYRNLRQNKKNRYMLSAGLSYEILDWLTLSGRVRLDNSHNKFTEKFYATTNTQLTEQSNNGLFGLETSEDKQVYADVLLDINKTWEDWSLHANVGASITDMRNDMFSNRGPIASDNIPNVFNVFSIDQSAMVKSQSGWREQTQSVYASAEIGFKSAYYLTLTGRNDWPSQLAGPRSKTKSYFYPSVGASVVLSEIIPNMPRQLEYMKLRASFADVGTPFDRWLANPLHEWPNKGNAWATDTTYPVELKPERTQSWEIGLQMRFLEWFSLDATYYRTNTKNQTFFPDISTGSGYSEIPIQSGNVLNEGFELALGFEKQWGIFNWSSNYTFSTNRNEIIELAENAINPVTGEKLNISLMNMGGLGNARFILKEGGTLGDVYSRQDFVRDSNGAIYIDADGKVSTRTIDNQEDYIKLGSVLPKANMAWRNDFRIGNFNLGFMLTARLGGVVFSRTQAMLDYYGVSEATATARDNGGVMVNGSDLVDANTWYTAIATGDVVPQYYTYSATNVRLQEASIGYTFPRKMLNNVCELTLQLVGRNLWMIYNKAPFDPEAIATTGNYYQGIDYFMMPSTRNFGFNIRLKF
ncbi:MAG: SusC/RagA family TonB-linked outer membrane protein [Bacteroidetes bacterium]|uniref:SusC/RagA family TonB-linked outer membrane protein n=1 Tax=Candidatus Cryptobacteroides faecipullorum TaxID=2840764 RepID=A0A9D9I7X3_9BACT|nr:SusC/RagA family TonB-linked outer membrane protein [Candidatus Cryptobacteroides faecipullorum]